MSDLTVHDDFERLLVDWLDETAGQGVPAYLDETLVRIVDVRQRPVWMSPGRWLPMRTLTMQRHRIPSAVPLLVAVALLLALAIAAVVIVGSQQTRLPPPFGLAGTGGFAYDSGGDLFVTDPDGSNARALVSGPGEQFGPAFSRDGTRLAYWSKAPYPSLWVSAADGRDPRQVAKDLPAEPQAESPAADWSPDGRELAFVVGSHLFVVGADGTGLREIGDPRLFEARADPAWSPDGSLIAVFGYTGAEALLHVIEPDGEGEQLVGGSPGIPISYRPAWSPDGSALIYSAAGDGGEDVVMARRSGSTWQEEVVVGGPTADSWPRFSNDGTRISFLRAGDSDFGYIVIADASGSNERQLHSGPIRHASHCWAPDDRSIMAVSGIGGDPKPGHVVLSVDGTAPPREIPVDDRVAYFACSWQRTVR
jgi:Tol biopolymer transport system component